MATLKEIAKAVGVSSTTVSRVLNLDQTLSVAAKTRNAIIEAAEAMKYESPRARSRANQQGLARLTGEPERRFGRGHRPRRSARVQRAVPP